MNNLKVEEVFKKVEEQQGRPFQGARIYEYMEPHTSHAQGDVEIVRLEKVPDGLKPIDNFNGILSVGLSNSGNHVILEKDLEFVKAYEYGGEYDGPILEIEKSWTLTHPNHKWVTFPAGCFQVKFPREMHLGEMRKQMD